MRAERAQVIDGLNRLALQHAGRSFNELAFSAPPAPNPPPAPPRRADFDIAALRALLNAAFSDEELTTLCFDHFRPVYDQFSTGMARTAKIQHLLEYAEKRQQVARLIELVEDLNPAQVAAHRGRLRRGAVVLGDVNTGGGAIVNGDVSTGGDFVGRDRH
ncbi:MAG: hypothetical protein IPO15_06430 [Anaerolineae bacterium]|uniref:hypothetical protein n=1 Tax=Candidatus Amarolinea dominans TaxID=3140696 RepID=UPI003136044B|nr:hypothetical protein [Anaerolineae bacterium]